jgi:hypothetical protein
MHRFKTTAVEKGHRKMKRYLIERDIPTVGTFDKEQLRGASKVSNEALSRLAPRVQWDHSYVAANKTFCVYLAEDEAAIRKHAELSGFPANVITEISAIIDPTTAG